MNAVARRPTSCPSLTISDTLLVRMAHARPRELMLRVERRRMPSCGHVVAFKRMVARG